MSSHRRRKKDKKPPLPPLPHTTVRGWLAGGGQVVCQFVHTLMRWLVAPVWTAERCALKGLEWFRAFFSGSTVFLVIGAVEYAAANLHLLPGLKEEKALAVSTVLGVTTFTLHLGAQFFQQSPAYPPASVTPPPTDSNQAPIFVNTEPPQ